VTRAEKLLSLLPKDGSTIGNKRLRESLGWREVTYRRVRDALILEGMLELGRGRGGSVARSRPERPALPRLKVVLQQGEAMRITRVAMRANKLVYVIVADRKVRYPLGSSGIVYVGTTKKGVSRVAQSAAYWTEDVLALRGVRAFRVRILTCPPRQKVKTWRLLERALLVGFRALYGRVPRYNSQGRRMRLRDESRFFSYQRVKEILQELA
jgi:hypothetical protein